MSFMSSLFPSKKPTSIDAEAALARLHAAHRDAVSDIAKAEATLARIVDLSDADHAAADALSAAGQRTKLRIEAQMAEVETARDDAAKAEASAAFFTRRDAADRLVEVAYVKAEAKLREAFEKAAEAAAEMVRIDETVDSLNREIAAARKADKSAIVPALVPTSDDRYRAEGDIVTPGSSYEEQKVCVHGTFGPVPINVSAKREGEQIFGAGEFLHKFTRTAPEQRRPGRRMMAPTSGLVLPATRIGEAPFWPVEGR